MTSNTTIELKKDACYIIEDEIQIFDKTNFIIHGNNATFKRTKPNGVLPKGNHLHVHIARSSNITVKDLNIQGTKPDTEGYNSGREAQHGFGLYGVVGATFSNVRINQIWGDCFYFNQGAAGSSRNITITSSYCNQTGRHGAAFLGAADININHSTFQNNHRQNFDFEPNGPGRGGANNITIDSNVIGGGTMLMISAESGSPELHNLVFTNNTVHKRFTIVIQPGRKGRRGPVTIANNVSDVPNKNGAISIQGVDGGVVRGNKILFDSSSPNPSKQILLKLDHSRNFRLLNNQGIGAFSSLQVDDLSTNVCEKNNTPAPTGVPVCVN